jgi:ferritin
MKTVNQIQSEINELREVLKSEKSKGFKSVQDFINFGIESAKRMGLLMEQLEAACRVEYSNSYK